MIQSNPHRFIAVLLLLAVATPPVMAQEAAGFQRVVGGPELDRGVFVSPTRDGGYIVAGVTKNTAAGDEDVYLVKFDSAGDTIWTRTYGGEEQDNGWSVHEIDSGYAVAGYTKSFGAGGFDFYLVVTDAVGELRWSKTYGGEADDRCWGLLPTPDGGYALVGETFSSGAGAEDFLLVKTDAAGKEEWSRTYGGEAGDRAFSIAATDDGGFLLVGQTYSKGAGERDAWVIKTDASGNEEWSKVFGGAQRDVAHSVARMNDGQFLITGYTASFAETGYDPWIIKIDAQGNVPWTRVLPIGGVSRAITGVQGTGGLCFFVGFTHNPEDGSSAALLIRTNRNGLLQMSREFFRTAAGQSFGYTVSATPGGGCVFTGHTTEGSAGDLDLFIVKVDAAGN